MKDVISCQTHIKLLSYLFLKIHNDWPMLARLPSVIEKASLEFLKNDENEKKGNSIGIYYK